MGNSTIGIHQENTSAALVKATEGVITANAATVTPLSTTAGTRYSKLWIYPYKGMVSGVGTPNTGNIYVGKTAANQPDVLTPTGGPIAYQFPDGQCGDLSLVNIQTLNNGDGVFFSYT